MPTPSRAASTQPFQPTTFQWLAVGVLLLAADWGSKWAVTTWMMPGAPHRVVGDLFRVTLLQNFGGPFGLSFGAWNLPVFSLTAALALAVLTLLWRDTLHPVLRLALVLAIAGGLGNGVERLVRGSVTDFVDLGLGASRFWTFNLADVWLTLAAVLAFLAPAPAKLDDPSAPRPLRPPGPMPQDPVAPPVLDETRWAKPSAP